MNTTSDTQDTAPAPVREEPGFDDGLVHDHGWACSERGEMARG